MKILPIVKGIRNNVVSSVVHVRNVSSDGYNVAIRASKVYKHGMVKKYYGVTKSVTNKVFSNAAKNELPCQVCRIGTNLMGSLFTALGEFTKKSSKGAHIMYDKSSQAHHFKLKSEIYSVF